MTTTNTGYTVLYFAALAEATGKSAETISESYPDLAALYAALQSKYGFTLAQNQLRVARNQSFCQWTDAPQAGDEIAFIPPVAGG
ncbi:MoaD/ThiS family protein [Cardiobacteriaceae bacterium TAE3-ERU3]|nr:MoaD/ThiS family protein [Cardiobacteriaceae bacterium TAE3-ERU3]